MAQPPTTVARRRVFLRALVLALCFRWLEWILIGGRSSNNDASYASSALQQQPTTTPSSNINSDAESNKQPRPQGLRLVLIGDSLTRYTYLSLVYFLRWGSWYDPTHKTPHLVQSSSFTNLWHNQTWGEHSWQTNRMLSPNELCDCYRKLPGRLQINKVVNNRYFYEPKLDNFVVYLDAKGHKGSMHGRITPQNVSLLLEQQRELNNNNNNDGKQQLLSPPFDSLKRPFAWVHTSWSDVITHYVSQLNPQPTHVVMNAGLWPNNFLYQPNLVEDIQQTIATNLPANAKGTWKTTSYGKGGKVLWDSIPPTDEFMCLRLKQCWNLSWTQQIADHWYWDDKHFYEPVYRIMNEDFLQQIGVLPTGYKKLDRSILFV